METSHTRVRRGENHPNVKLTDAQVREMRELRTTAKKGYRALAAIFGCSIATARDIVLYKTRKSA